MNVVDNINHNLKRSIPLTKPIEFLIRHKPLRRVRKRKCTYWEFKYAAWSSDGCYTIREIYPGLALIGPAPIVLGSH